MRFMIAYAYMGQKWCPGCNGNEKCLLEHGATWFAGNLPGSGKMEAAFISERW